MPVVTGGWDMILYLVAMVLVSIAQSRVMSTYRKYSAVRTVEGMTGAEVARKILEANGIHDVQVKRLPGGTLNDHYDPRIKVANLSPDIYDGTSIASVSVAAHEIGHAIQHNVGYRFLAFRNNIAPIVSITSGLSLPILMIGLFSQIGIFFTIAVILFFSAAIFQLVTLPVEFDASARALKNIQTMGILTGPEINDSKTMLNAAAFTYVAALANTLLQIIRIMGYRNQRNS